MSKIFLSHSSQNDAQAVALAQWLREAGWDDLFLDLDPDRGIAAGERWERALHAAVNRCEAVLFLVSRDWLASQWCQRELNLAIRLNKQIFAVLIEDMPVADLPPEITRAYQVINLAIGSDGIVLRAAMPDRAIEEHVTFSQSGLDRLRRGLRQAGLDPFYFEWPPPGEPDRAPWRGLSPLEAEDAGIFYGREAQTIQALDALRGMAASPPGQYMVILGASGSGKSSFLRAGLWPRLERDDRHTLPLPVIRPERNALAAFTQSLERVAAARALRLNRADIARAVNAGGDDLTRLLSQLQQAARGSADDPPPVVVVPVDQAEELFHGEAGAAALTFLTHLAALAKSEQPRCLLLFTIRSDAYEPLQTAKILEGLAPQLLPLLPIPSGNWGQIIEGPLARLEAAKRPLKIEPALIERLLAELEAGGSKDALPLLSFTLESLYVNYGADGDLKLSEYEEFGGLAGAINAAVERALDAANVDPRVPKDTAARRALMRRAFIPWLCGIDPATSLPRRAQARFSDIPDEAKPIVEHLIEVRLLATDTNQETGVRIIEPAHEALLRQWSLLEGWLKEDAGLLATLEAIRRAARDWLGNGRNAAWLAHRSGRLEEAERLNARPDLAAKLDAVDRDYLARCRAAENADAARKRRQARRIRLWSIAATILAVIALGMAWYGFDRAREAERQAEIATQQTRLAEERQKEAETERNNALAEQVKADRFAATLSATVVNQLSAEGSNNAALLLGLDAAAKFDDQAAPDELRIALSKVLLNKARLTEASYFPDMRMFETEDAVLVQNPADNSIYKLDDQGGLALLQPADTAAAALLFVGQVDRSPTLILAKASLAVETIDLESQAARTIGRFPDPPERPQRTYAKPEYYEPEYELVGGKFLIRPIAYADPGEPYGSYFQVMFLDTGKVVGGDVTSLNAVLGKKIISGDLYFFSMNYGGDQKRAQAWRVQPAGDEFTLVERAADPVTVFDLLSCVDTMSAALKQSIIDDLGDLLGPPDTRLECSQQGERYLITVYTTGSSGVWRTDKIYSSSGDAASVQDMFASENPTSSRFSWVKLVGDYSVGVLFDRRALVSSGDGIVLDYRHHELAQHAAFIGETKLAVFQEQSGTVLVHDFGSPFGRTGSFLDTANREKIGTGDPIDLLHHGTCVGHDVPRPETEALPDGSILSYADLPRPTSYTEDGKARIVTLNGSSRRELVLDNGAGCVQFSDDWRKFIVIYPYGFSVYDLAKALESGSLKAGELFRVPTGRSPNSATFLGADDTRVVQTDYSNVVTLWTYSEARQQWSSSELYRGDYPLISAEPDRDGQRLIIIESVSGGSGDIHGRLYSLAAHQDWFDLGNDYKWLGAAFTQDSEIAVSRHSSWAAMYPFVPLSALVTTGNRELSSACAPGKAGDYRSSSCWPSQYK